MCIWIYKDINGTQDKRSYDDKVPVQIEGHVDKNRKYIDEQKITYFVDLDDLDNIFRTEEFCFLKFYEMETSPDAFYAIVKQFSNESKKQGFGHEQMV